MPLSKRDLDRLTWNPQGPSTQIHMDSDGDIPGFGVRVYESGKKAFVLRYRAAGARQPKNHTLGPYGALTLHQARELARTTLLQVRTGSDPAAERRRAREGETIRDLCAIYLARHKDMRPATRREAERRIDTRILPAIGNKKVAEVERADVARLHARITDTAPVEANRVVQLLRAMLSRAQEWGLMPEGVPNPATRVRLNKEQSRERWVQPDEMPQLVAAIDAEADGTNPQIAAVLKLYLLTGCRRNELLRLRWSDVNLQRGELYLRETKNGEARTVHLGPDGVSILRDLPRDIGGAYVFPGRVAGQPLVNINKAWRRVRARMWLALNPDAAAKLRQRAEAAVHGRSKHAEKGADAVEQCLLALAAKEIPAGDTIRLHDLRRTTGAMMATNGVPVAVVGKVLGHKSARATQIYARIADNAARNAVEQHGANMAAYLSVCATPA